MGSPAKQSLGACAVVFAAGVGVGYVLAPRLEIRPTRPVVTHAENSIASHSVQSPESAEERSRGPKSPSAEAGGRLGDDLPEALLAAAQQRNFFRRRRDVQSLAMQLDADGLALAMTTANQLSAADRDWVQPVLLERWTELDSAGAIGWVRALPGRAQRDDLLEKFFSTIGLIDPQAGLRFLDEQRGIGGNQYAVDWLFEGWAQADPRGAAEAAQTLSHPVERGSALETAVKKWALRAPLETLAWIESQPAVSRPGSWYVFNNWAEQDPQAAADYALTRTGPARLNAIHGVIIAVAKQDPAAAQALIAQLPAGPQRDSILSTVVSNLSDMNPRAATELLRALSPTLQEDAVSDLAYEYGRINAAEALVWAASLGNDALRRTAESRILERWAADDPQAVAKYCLAEGVNVEESLPDAVGGWAARDLAAALAWTHALPDAGLRDRALASASAAVAQTDPRQAVEIADRLPAGDARSGAYRAGAQGWARRDPAAAAEWSTKSGNAANPEVLLEIAPQWAAHDPAATGAWLDTVPAGAARDKAVVAFASKIVKSDAAGALAWAASIASPSLRETAVRDTFSKWVQRDKAAAVAWARRAPALSDAMRAELLNQ